MPLKPGKPDTINDSQDQNEGVILWVCWVCKKRNLLTEPCARCHHELAAYSGENFTDILVTEKLKEAKKRAN